MRGPPDQTQDGESAWPERPPHRRRAALPVKWTMGLDYRDRVTTVTADPVRKRPSLPAPGFAQPEYHDANRTPAHLYIDRFLRPGMPERRPASRRWRSNKNGPRPRRRGR